MREGEESRIAERRAAVKRLDETAFRASVLDLAQWSELTTQIV